MLQQKVYMFISKTNIKNALIFNYSTISIGLSVNILNVTFYVYVPAMVTDVGPITVDAGLWTLEGPFPEGLVLLDTDSYTFLSVPCPPPVSGATVPMQATGSPLAVAALGLLSIIGGAVYGKIR